MQTQSFMLIEGDDLQEVVSTHKEQAEAETERRTLLAELGFDRVHEWEQQGNHYCLEQAGMLYPELVGDELQLWRDFLPTVEDKSTYTFDRIPDEALQAMKTAQELDLFDEIQIWTPVGNTFREQLREDSEDAADTVGDVLQRIDPMAVGIIHELNGSTHHYQIVRWGEALDPIQDIKRHVRNTRWLNFGLRRIMPFLLMVAMITAFTVSTVEHGFVATLRYIGFGVGAAVGAAVGLAAASFLVLIIVAILVTMLDALGLIELQ